MKKTITALLAMIILIASKNLHAQNTFPSTGSVGIGTTSPSSSSLLEIKSTTKGLLIPRLTQTQRNAIASPVTGLLIYQTDNYPGFYYYDGAAWNIIGYWKKNGTSVFFNSGNVGFGTLSPAYKIDVKGGDINLSAGNYLRVSGTKVFNDNPSSGNNNVFVGDYTDTTSSPGFRNTAIGSNSLSMNMGAYNTAAGSTSLQYNTTGNSNSAFGEKALYINLTGDNNTAAGSGAMVSNQTGSGNTAVGFQNLHDNYDGDYNSGFGYHALYSNESGEYNTAIGNEALFNGTNPGFETAIGDQALYNDNGVNNVAIGFQALSNNVNGYNLTGLGTFTSASSDGLYNSTAVGFDAAVTTNNQVFVGNTSVSSIGGQVGWTNFSDGRYKQNIKQNVPGLLFINKLQPVTYTLNAAAIESKLHERQPALKTKDGKGVSNPINDSKMKDALQEKSQIIYTGFVAQDVEKAAQSLNYNFSGVDKPKDDSKSFYGLRYGDFVVPLVKAVQELSKMNDAKDSAMQQQDIKINDLQNQINELKAMIVSSQSTVSGQQATVLSPASLQQNVPNPFSNSTNISYILPQTYSSARIIITDNKGAILKQISLNAKGKGNLLVDASTLASGAYQYSLYINEKLIDTKKMLLSK